MEGEALCEGYAKAFDLLAKELDLPSVLVTGVDDSNGNHAWNQVKINGDWYNTDVTWENLGDILCEHIAAMNVKRAAELRQKPNNSGIEEQRTPQ